MAVMSDSFTLFMDVLNKAYSDWPETLELQTEACPGGDGYIVNDLYEQKDLICQKYLGTTDEVIFVNIHESIFEAVRNSAKFIKSIKVKSLREEEIFNIFKKKSTIIYSSHDLGLTDDDKQKLSVFLV